MSPRSANLTAKRGPKPKAEISKFVLDERCQARFKLSPEVVDDYTEIYRGDTKLPPIECFNVDGQLIVVDGYHRVAAAAKAERGWLHYDVVGEGTIEQAVWHATSVNQLHGLRRSNEDKRRAVVMALESKIGSGQSDRAIAEHVGVTHPFVARIRKELGDETSAAEEVDQVVTVTTSTGRDGKKYRRKSKPKAAPAEPKVVDGDVDEASPDDSPAADEPHAEAEQTEPAEQRAGYRLPNPEAIARLIQSLRDQIKRQWGEHQTIDGHLEKAWRAADDMILIDCEKCDGGGCGHCNKGALTKSDARKAREQARSKGIAAKARAEA